MLAKLSDLFFSAFPGQFLQVLPFVLAAGGIYWYRRYRTDKTTPPVKQLWSVLFVCYLTGLVCTVFFYSSIRYFWGFLFRHNKLSNVIEVLFCRRTANFIPDFYRHMDREKWLNVALSLPFGFLFPLAGKAETWKKTVGAGLLGVLLIETLQPVFARSFDVNDLILNSLGVLFSASVFFLGRGAVNRLCRPKPE